MAELFASGRIVDLILVLMIVLWVLVWSLNRLSVKVIAPLDYLTLLLPGAFLLLALRLALVNAAWQWMATALLAALLTHGLELWRRRAL